MSSAGAPGRPRRLSRGRSSGHPTTTRISPGGAEAATFLLVYGAWFGGWCRRKVTPLLRARGHEVFAPTLTGLGERSHLAQPSIGLETHIQDVVNVLPCEALEEVI